jgi:hypothetical protein
MQRVYFACSAQVKYLGGLLMCTGGEKASSSSLAAFGRHRGHACTFNAEHQAMPPAGDLSHQRFGIALPELGFRRLLSGVSEDRGRCSVRRGAGFLPGLAPALHAAEESLSVLQRLTGQRLSRMRRVGLSGLGFEHSIADGPTGLYMRKTVRRNTGNTAGSADFIYAHRWHSDKRCHPVRQKAPFPGQLGLNFLRLLRDCWRLRNSYRASGWGNHATPAL